MRTSRWIAIGATALLLGAKPAHADTIYAVAPPFFLLQFDSASPGTITRVAVITGLQSGERLEAIDFRLRTGPNVRVVSGANGSVLLNLFAYDAGFFGGVRVAAADFDRDGDYEIITAAGFGGGPHVKVFDSAGNPFTSASLPGFVNNFFAYPAGFFGGVFVAAGDVNGDGVPDIITGAGVGGGPHVKVFNGLDGALITQFFAYEPTFSGGVQVAVGDVNGDGRYEIITTPGPGRVAEARVFDGITGAMLEALQPYGAFPGGAFVSGVRR